MKAADTEGEFLGQPCAFCGAASQGNWKINRDAPNIGPFVPLCNYCHSTYQVSTIWQRISTWVQIPNEVSARLLRSVSMEKKLVDVVSERYEGVYFAPRWAIAVALAFASATMLTLVWQLDFVDVFDQVWENESLQNAVSAAYTLGASPTDILVMVRKQGGYQ